MPIHHIPDGYHSVVPYLTVHDAAAALEFYKTALGAVERMRMAMPGGKVGHAEITIGNSTIMVSDEFPEMGVRSPRSIGGTASSVMIYVEKVDDVARKALAAGAREVRPVKDQFYGDRSGTFEDPFGHRWIISTHIEDVSPEEMQRRAAAAMSGQPC